MVPSFFLLLLLGRRVMGSDKCGVCQRVTERIVMVYEELKQAGTEVSPQESALGSVCGKFEGTRLEKYLGNVTVKECEAVVDIVEGSLASLLETEAYHVTAFDGAASMARAYAIACKDVCHTKFTLASPAAGNRSKLPTFALCETGVSLEVEWFAAPSETRSYAVSFRPLFVEPGSLPVFHWLGWDLTPDQSALHRGASLPTVAVPYHGPCPVEQTAFRLEVLALAREAPLDLQRPDDPSSVVVATPQDFYLATRGAILDMAFLDFVALQPPSDGGVNDDEL